MTTVRLKFRPSSRQGQEGTLYYQVIHDRKIRQIYTGHRILSSEWDETAGRIISPPSEVRSDTNLIVRREMERLQRISKRLEAAGDFTLDDIIEEYKRFTREYTLFNYFGAVILQLRRNGRLRTAETYSQALNSFRNFLENKDIMLDLITPEIMERFEVWHTQRGNTPNTISFYMRIIRAVYNRAVEDGAIDDRNPFRRVYTGVDKTVKRALPLKVIKRIKALDLTDNPALDQARDIFILSFMFRGMSFIDMAYLKKKDLRQGYITYRRQKTGQILTIAWTKDMQRILDKYPLNETEYLLPIIKNRKTDARYAYRRECGRINNLLKEVGQMAGVPIPLTLYVARHSWASAARAKGVPVSVISEGMGHDREATTRIYLASLENSVIDEANDLILSSI